MQGPPAPGKAVSLPTLPQKCRCDLSPVLINACEALEQDQRAGQLSQPGKQACLSR